MISQNLKESIAKIIMQNVAALAFNHVTFTVNLCIVRGHSCFYISPAVNDGGVVLVFFRAVFCTIISLKVNWREQTGGP